MICPRCLLEGLPAAAPGCPNCGLSFGDEGLRSEPVAAELEQALRRELGGQYQIADLLGRGGMSLVYLAQEIELNRQVAIKILPLQFVHGPAAVERFEREARIAAGLDHPHIVPIFRVGATGTFLWYTMKRIRGRTLEQLIAERGAIPAHDFLQIIEQVGSALHYAHRHGVVHRDVKPANVMIEDSGWALVCDFGVARAFGSVSLTETGNSLGTPRYMSPEQFEGHPVDGRSDQYSLGVLAWEALTGGLPFTGDSLGELIRKHLLEPAPKLAELNAEIPVHVSEAVHRAMSKKPVERFPDIETFIAALGGKAAPRIPVGFSGPMPAVQRARVIWDSATVPLRLTVRRRPLMVTSVAAGVALLGGAFWIAVRPGTPANGATRTPSVQTLPDTPRTASPSARDSAPPPRPAPVETPVTEKPATPPPPPAPAPARLYLSTQPWGRVEVDGRFVGNTPIQGVRLSPGRRQVRVERDGFVPFDTVVTVSPGQAIRWTRIALKRVGG